MKLKRFGKALLTGALSLGVVFGVSSCIASYTVGFLYVTGSVTAQPNGNGIVTGYKIDHNTGQLSLINQLPVSSGGANPVRAVLTNGSRFLYVLNRGLNAAGDSNCYGTGANKCLNSNIVQFAVGGNGVLTFQGTYYTQGLNPFRLITDAAGSYLLVLDHDAPSSSGCQAALGNSVTACGDVTVFSVDSTTGRLSLVQNAQVSTAGGSTLPYFPVPANPVDFVMTGSNLLTLTASAAATSYPYTGGTSVFPYTYASSSGQLTLSQNSAQPLNITAGTAIVNAASNIFVLDNEPLTITGSGGIFPPGVYPSQILAYTVGANGALQAQTSGAIPESPSVSNPIALIQDSSNQFIYVANQGNNVTGTNTAASGIAGFYITNNPAFQLNFNTPNYWGAGSGPQCIVEDPSKQFIFTANAGDSTVTGQLLDPHSGVLSPLRFPSVTLQGPASWCLMDGRTD